MKVVILCEFSGIVRDAFIKRGFDAISCDILPTEVKGPHITGDLRDFDFSDYDLLIAHPPCTYLSTAGNKYLYHPGDSYLPINKRRPHPMHPERRKRQIEAVNFVKYIASVNIKHKAIENPVGILSSKYRKPDQYIQPYEFGDSEQKKTGLWLFNLPKLVPTKIVKPKVFYRIGKNGKKYFENNWHKNKCQKERSKTFKGIAEAMATQWGDFLKNESQRTNFIQGEL